MIVCGDIGNRREIGHRKDQGVLATWMDQNLCCTNSADGKYLKVLSLRAIQSKRKNKKGFCV